MGWTYMKGATRASTVDDIKSGRELGQAPVATALKGNDLWAVFESRERPGEFFIAVCYLQEDKGYGWGYKIDTEDMGPYCNTVPVSWLDKYPTSDPPSLAWRADVRAANRPIVIGSTQCATGSGLLTIVGMSGRQYLAASAGGRVYTMSKNLVLRTRTRSDLGVEQGAPT